MCKTHPLIVWEADRLGAHRLRQYLRVGLREVALLPYSVLVGSHCIGPCQFTCSTAHTICKCGNNIFFLPSITVFKSAKKSEALVTGRETNSKLLCTVLEKTVLLKDIQTEMSQSWALTYCKWSKKCKGWQNKHGHVMEKILSWHDLHERCAKSFCREGQIPCLMTTCLNLGLYDTLNLQ